MSVCNLFFCKTVDFCPALHSFITLPSFASAPTASHDACSHSLSLHSRLISFSSLGQFIHCQQRKPTKTKKKSEIPKKSKKNLSSATCQRRHPLSTFSFHFPFLVSQSASRLVLVPCLPRHLPSTIKIKADTTGSPHTPLFSSAQSSPK